MELFRIFFRLFRRCCCHSFVVYRFFFFVWFYLFLSFQFVVALTIFLNSFFFSFLLSIPFRSVSVVYCGHSTMLFMNLMFYNTHTGEMWSSFRIYIFCCFFFLLNPWTWLIRYVRFIYFRNLYDIFSLIIKCFTGE